MRKTVNAMAAQSEGPQGDAVNWTLWRWMWRRIGRLGRGTPRRLRLSESLPLGERRFVAVIECDESRFLVGGTASSLVLLTKLEPGSPSSAGTEDEEEAN